MSFSDLFRAIVLSISGVSLSLSALVIGLYFWRWRKNNGGHLFAHVWGIALSHLGYVVISMIVMFSRIGKELTWLGWAYMVCAILGGWAMYKLTRYELQFFSRDAIFKKEQRKKQPSP
jgi:hypothetical protein